MIDLYLYATTLVFFLLMMVWSRSTWINFSIKIVFTGLFASGMFLSLIQLGYMVKV